MSLLIVGNRGGASVGEALWRGAVERNLRVGMVDMQAATHPNRWINAVSWHGMGHRPGRLGAFSRHVLAEVVRQGASVLLTTGQAPVRARELAVLGERGVWRINYSTDDPWNAAHRARWFLETLPNYDVIFTPRSSNVSDFRTAGVQDVRRITFGYEPAQCIGSEPTADEVDRLACDVLFVGGADQDRAPFAEALSKAGLDVALYGGYWNRYPSVRSFYRGIADPETVRKATQAARVSLILVRRANRDGHTMRSVEAAAIGACLLAEDTPDHRALYGDDGAIYFTTEAEMVAGARRLLANAKLRETLANRVRRLIRGGSHTYADQIEMLMDRNVLGGPLAKSVRGSV